MRGKVKYDSQNFHLQMYVDATPHKRPLAIMGSLAPISYKHHSVNV
jgi:hypothetical protein